MPAKSRLVQLIKELDVIKPGYIITLHMPYHSRLAYLLNDSRKNEGTTIKSLIEFFSNVPRGYGGTSSITMEVKESINGS